LLRWGYFTAWQRLYPFEAASEGETERLQDEITRVITANARIIFFIVFV
jgi:hypothetical protein